MNQKNRRKKRYGELVGRIIEVEPEKKTVGLNRE
jgi:hypothetical protein